MSEFKAALRLSVILPTKDKHGVALSADVRKHILNTVQVDFSFFAGGYTQTDTAGGWLNDGEVMTEESLTIWTDCVDIDIDCVFRHAETIARIVANLSNQECVATSVMPLWVAYVA